jgi:hypothetical protein
VRIVDGRILEGSVDLDAVDDLGVVHDRSGRSPVDQSGLTASHRSVRRSRARRVRHSGHSSPAGPSGLRILVDVDVVGSVDRFRCWGLGSSMLRLVGDAFEELLAGPAVTRPANLWRGGARRPRGTPRPMTITASTERSEDWSGLRRLGPPSMTVRRRGPSAEQPGEHHHLHAHREGVANGYWCFVPSHSASPGTDGQ